MNILGLTYHASCDITEARCFSFASPSPTNFENSALTPVQLLFGLALGSSSKIFDAQLTQVYARKMWQSKQDATGKLAS